MLFTPCLYHNTSSEAARLAPPFVRNLSPRSIQLFHSSLTLYLNGLLRLTSSGCSKEVKPPGITATSVLVLDNLALEFSDMWLRNISQTNRLCSFLIPSGHLFQTFSIHNFSPFCCPSSFFHEKRENLF